MTESCLSCWVKEYHFKCFSNTDELGYDGPLYDRFMHMTDDMLGPSSMNIKYSSYVYNRFCIWRTNFPGPIESVISKFTCTTLFVEEKKKTCSLNIFASSLIMFHPLLNGSNVIAYHSPLTSNVADWRNWLFIDNTPEKAIGNNLPNNPTARLRWVTSMEVNGKFSLIWDTF